MGQFFHRGFSACEVDLLPGTARGREESKVLRRKFSFFQQLQNDSPNGTSRTCDGHGIKHRRFPFIDVLKALSLKPGVSAGFLNKSRKSFDRRPPRSDLRILTNPAIRRE